MSCLVVAAIEIAQRDPEWGELHRQLEMWRMQQVTIQEVKTQMSILDQVLKGVPSDRRSRVHRIVDRKEAITKAINEAALCDVVVIAGKGHEKNQILKDCTIPFDDCLVAEEAIKNRFNGAAK